MNCSTIHGSDIQMSSLFVALALDRLFMVEMKFRNAVKANNRQISVHSSEQLEWKIILIVVDEIWTVCCEENEEGWALYTQSSFVRIINNNWKI